MYELEEVNDVKAKEFAMVYFTFIKQQVGAIFKYTSAKSSSGVDNIFECIGRELLNLNFESKEEVNEHEHGQQNNISLVNRRPTIKNKKSCC